MSENLETRFLAVRKALHLSTEEFGARVNISPSYVNLIENGHRKPSARIVASLFSELGVSRSWWETGEGRMFADKDGLLQKSLSTEDIELVNLWRVLDAFDQAAVLSLVRMLARRHIY